MSSHFVEYPLRNGFVGHWLVAGPQEILLGPDAWTDDVGRRQLLQRYLPDDSGITAPPVERGPLEAGRFALDGLPGEWNYVACPEDCTLDRSDTFRRAHFLRSWAFVELVSDRDQTVEAMVTANGLVDIWLGDTRVYAADRLQAVTQPATMGSDDGQHVHSCRVLLPLRTGATPLLVRFARVGLRHSAHTLAVRIGEPGEDGAVWSPVTGVTTRFETLMSNVARRNAFEQLSADAYVDRDVYIDETPIRLCWPDAPRARVFAHARLQNARNQIYAIADTAGGETESIVLGHPVSLPAGSYHVRLMPDAREVYEQGMRIFRTLPLVALGRQRHYATPVGDMASRRNEGLLALARQEGTPLAQIARMAWGAWADVDDRELLDAIARVRACEDGSHMDFLALLGMLMRWGEHAHFPATLRGPLEAAMLAYRYAAGDAGHDGMDFARHGGELVFAACELLAGQWLPGARFADGQTGAWHAARGARRALGWMADFGAYGAADWNAPMSLARETAALAYLIDLADDEQVIEMATVALDKRLFALALHQWRGALGVVGRTVGAEMVKSAYLQPTAPLAYLLWGTGILNQHGDAFLSMACSMHYEMPALLQTIALDTPDELWSREQHTAPGEVAVNIANYRTPDFCLSSLQDYRSDETGAQEMVWRAMLSAEAGVFATLPGSSAESDSRYPGFWAGNARLPRVAQWRDVLAAFYRIEPDDRLAFTHVYFPTATFDEHVLRDGWAFARVGDGYMAITNSAGMSLTTAGPYALRELRASGSLQCWLVQMGRAARDGDFAAFQAKVLALPLALSGETVAYTTLDGSAFRFGRQGPLVVDGITQPTSGYPHYDNPYTTTALAARQMEIRCGKDGLRLEWALTHDARDA